MYTFTILFPHATRIMFPLNTSVFQSWKSMAVVNLHGKEKSANVIKDLEMGETILDYQGGPNTIMKVLVREKSIFIWTSHGLK